MDAPTAERFVRSGNLSSTDPSVIGAVSANALPDGPLAESVIAGIGSGEAEAPASVEEPDDVGSGYYLLPETKKSDWVYQGANQYEGDYHCIDEECTLTNEVRVWFKETVQGGTSRLWDIQYNVRLVKGTSDYQSTYNYWCAVNLADEPDENCLQWRTDDSSPHDSALFDNTDDQYYSFGSSNNVKKYPMVNIVTLFPDTVSDTAKWRGWDTCTSATNNQLCATSGTGY